MIVIVIVSVIMKSRTRECKDSEFQTELLKLKSENDQLEENAKLALSDSKTRKIEMDQVAKHLKTCEQALEGTENYLKNVNIE